MLSDDNVERFMEQYQIASEELKIRVQKQTPTLIEGNQLAAGRVGECEAVHNGVGGKP